MAQIRRRSRPRQRLSVAALLAVLLCACGTGVTTSPVAQPSPTPTVATPGKPTPSPSPRRSFASRSPTPTAPDPTGPTVATYVFPVQPVTDASYGREHHDYPATDIFAPCGTEVVASTSGIVQEVATVDSWDPAVNDGATRGGLSVSIVGDDGVRHYGSHLATIADGIEPGARIVAGRPLGTVGRTGSAQPTPCHLHFGLSPDCGPGDWEVRRGVIETWLYLDAWRDGQPRSPRVAIDAWLAANPDRCARTGGSSS